MRPIKQQALELIIKWCFVGQWLDDVLSDPYTITIEQSRMAVNLENSFPRNESSAREEKQTRKLSVSM